MDTPDPLDPENLDANLARRIDAVCRAFENAWHEGAAPRIEDRLDDVPEPGRRALFVELIALERELLAERGTTAQPADYLARFPGCAEEVARAFEATGSIASEIPPGMSYPGAPTLGSAASAEPPATEMPTDGPARAPDPAELPTVPPIDDVTMGVGAAPGARPDGEPTTVRYFGDYLLERVLARGGMGVVYKARQINLNRTVALKMILAGQLASEDDVKRFYLEAEAAANLDHPGIVPIFEVGQHEGQHFFSMGFVEGRSLARAIAEHPLPPREAAELLAQLAEAVQYAHAQGVIHRDLKPGNVLIDLQGRPKLTDFGLAKKLEADSSLTHTGQVMGTPSYMPPEQAQGKSVGRAADVYGLGAVLYCTLTGRPPFQAATPMDTLAQVIGQDPVPVRQLNATVPRDLETICLKCLEKEPARRYPSAAALGDDLRRFLAGEPIEARPVTRVERAVKWARRRPVIAGLSSALVVIGLLGLSGIIWQWLEAVVARREAQAQTKNAREQAGIARENEKAALSARSDAQVQERISREEAELANRRLYGVKMNLVQRAWENWNPKLFSETLDEQLPENQGGVDRRGFEWYYWHRKVASGHRTLKGYIGGVYQVAFSPDGKRLASASDDTVKLWDVATAKEILTLKGHKADVVCVAFSPDGKRLASGSNDMTVKVWDLGSGLEALTINGHTAKLLCMDFRPDSKELATGGQSGEVIVWDAATGQETIRLRTDTGFPIHSVAFSPDGKQLACACRGGSGDKSMRVWDTVTWQETFSLMGHDAEVYAVAFSPDGGRIASCANDSLKFWDSSTGHLSFTIHGSSGDFNSVAFCPDGKRVASASSHSTVIVWDVATREEKLRLKGHTGLVISVAFSPDGTRIASADSNGTVKVWDAATGQETPTLEGGAVSLGFGGRLVSVTLDATVWGIATGQEILRFRGFKIGGELLYTPDGKLYTTAHHDETVKVWELPSGREALRLKGHTAEVYSVVFSPDGNRLASASFDGKVKIWDTATGQETLTLEGPLKPQFLEGEFRNACLAFSRDGKLLASARWDGMVKVWDAREVTPELLDRDEARGLILFLIDRSATESELRDRIASDATRSPAVRSAAQDMVRVFWASKIRRRAEAIVEPLFDQLLLRDEVLAILQAQAARDPDLQAACLKLAETWPESSVLKWNDVGWNLVRDPGRPEAIYERGLRLARAACEREPNNGLYLNTLGVAQYRAGLLAEALATLTRSNALNNEKQPADVAFLAMAHQRLGHPAEARALLDRLAEVMQTRRDLAANQLAEDRAFLSEAEAVVLYDPILPADPFAR